MKYSHKIVGALAVALIAVPFLSSALSIDELNQQIATLLSQVAALQQKIAAQTQTTPSGGTQVNVSTPIQNTASFSTSCPQLSRTLGLGAQGDDVLALQRYLISERVLSADSATGFYGALTQAAVQNWQSSHGVVLSGDPTTTGFGVVGARTRSLIGINCSLPSTSQVPQTQTASFACQVANPPTSSCSAGWKAIKDSAGCTVAYDCATPLPTVTPATPHVCPVYGIPTCGTGYSPQATGADSAGCGLPMRCVANGITTPIACPSILLAPCPTGQHYESYNPPQYSESYARCKIETRRCVPDGSGSAPIITAVDGPATLGANQAGTWVVRASVPNQSNTSIRYSVSWGDELNWAYNTSSNSAQALSTISTSGTFTHTYTYPGNFTPTFTVSNDSGSTSFKTSVQVSGGIINCPIYAQSSMAIACPAGQHWEPGTPTYDANNCPVPYSGKCVPDTNAPFSASPTSGTAPLAVSFSSRITGQGGGTYVINYGDGTANEKAAYCYAPLDYCQTPGINTHVYNSAGTYTAVLKRIVGATENYSGGDTNLYETLGTVTITIGSNTGTPSISVSASPSTVRQSGYQQQNGGTLVASWSAQNMPSNSSVGIALYDDKGTSYGYIGLGKGANGTINWTVPGSNCDSSGSCFFLADSPSVWSTKPGTYRLVGQIYTPSNACFGFCPAPGPTFVATGYSSWFTITQ